MNSRLMNLASLAVVFFLLFPLIVIIGASFTTTPYVKFPPSGFTLKWYGDLFARTDFLRAFIDSVLIGVVTVGGVLLIGTPTAFGLRLGSRVGRQVLQSFVTAPLTLPTIVTAVALLQVYYLSGWDFPWIAVTLGHILVTLPYYIRTLGAGLESLDNSVLEAAESLGASRQRILRRIIIPAVLPSIFSGTVFVFITSFDQVTMSIFFSSGSFMPLPIRIFSYIEFAIDPMIAAVSTLLIIAAFGAVFAMQKVMGLERGIGA